MSQVTLVQDVNTRVWFFLQRQLVTCEAEQNSIMGKLDEGLDDFFYKKVIKVGLK